MWSETETATYAETTTVLYSTVHHDHALLNRKRINFVSVSYHRHSNKPFRHSQSIMGMDDKHWPCLSHKPMAHHGSSWILSSFSRKLDGVQQWKLHSKCVNNQAPKLNFCYNIERAVLEKSVFFPPHWLDDGLGARRQQYTHRPVRRAASSLRAPILGWWKEALLRYRSVWVGVR